VKSAHLSAGTDEEKGTCHILLSYTLSAECYLTVADEVKVVEDAFSSECETVAKTRNDGGRYLMKHAKTTERVSGAAVISPEIEGEYVLQAAVLPRAELTCKKTDHGFEAEGAVLAEVLFCSADGAHRSATLTLPVVFPLEADGDHVEIDCAVCSLNVRRKKSGEVEAEATLRIFVQCFEDRSWGYVDEVTEGEPYKDTDCGFSVFMTEAGEDLWQVSKRLACPPEDLQKCNPDLTFPLKERQRIFIYRQIR
jgi:hypothetical protein